ncbi:hypothetical protein GCM10010915_00310 [Microbacterium faecale]|uniref:DUF4352 domain-containing protein n=2 Tax=Microbacterium faecale TaxID=1804630 RepID=A0A916XZM8_9MICO|nr:hypothetical protein GCM10010915_00310 [Microbacterium faecale]
MRHGASMLASAALVLGLAACSSASDGEPGGANEPTSGPSQPATVSPDVEEPDGSRTDDAEEPVAGDMACADPYTGDTNETDEDVAEFRERIDQRGDETVVDLGETITVDYHDGIQNHHFEFTVHSVTKVDEFNDHAAEEGCFLVAELEAKALSGDYFIAPPYVMKNLRNADGDLIRTANDDLDVVLDNEDDGTSHGPVVYEISEEDGTGSSFFRFDVGHDGHTIVVRQDEF